MSGIFTKIAHNNRISIGPKDTKLLAEVISTEKRVVESKQKVSGDLAKAAVAVKEWGQAEGPDLADILSKVSVLLEYLATAEQAFADHNNNFRIHFKNVRTREENLAALKRSHTSLASKIDNQEKKVSRMKEENKDLPAAQQRLAELRQEMIGLEQSVINEETRLADYKRITAREALSLKLGALLELAEKSTVIGEIGKLIVDEIPTERTEPGAARAPYHGYDRTDELMAEASRCLQDVVFNPMPISAGNPPSATMQRIADQQGGQQQARYSSDDQAGQNDDQIRRVGGPTYAGSYPMGPSHSRGNSHSQDGGAFLPAINTTAPLHSAHDRDFMGGGQQDSAVPLSPQAQQQRTGTLAAPANDYNNRSSLAYMGTTDDSRYHNDVTDRERRQADANAEADTENPWAKPDAPIDVVKQDAEQPEAASTTAVKDAPLTDNGNEKSRPFSANPVFLPPTASLAQIQQHAPQNPSPLANQAVPERTSGERPYIPKENDGAYHGPRPDQPPPRVVTPTFNTAPSSPALAQQQGHSPLAAAANLPPASGAAAASKPSKPPMMRGESALGSKHGDIYVAGRTDGPQQFSHGGPVNVPGAPFVAATASGYNTRGDSASVNSATDSSGRRVINAGAFRRPPGGGPPSAGYAPPSGYDSRFASAAPPVHPQGQQIAYGGAPSPADKIRDQYRAAYAEEDARYQSPTSPIAGPGPQQPLDGSASGVPPRFDVTPLNTQKRPPVGMTPGGVPSPVARPSTSVPLGSGDYGSPYASEPSASVAHGPLPARPMTPVANGSANGDHVSPRRPSHDANVTASPSGNYGVVQAVTRLD